MGIILNPDMDNSFISLVKSKDTEIFVDKTDFIEKFSSKINADKRFFCCNPSPSFWKNSHCTYALSLLFQGICLQKFLMV